MKLRNHTPFPMLGFESRDVDDRPFHTLVARATLKLRRDGGAMRLAPTQEPLRFDDAHAGEPGRSSVLAESDLAPARPATDVVVVGSARAPGAVPARSWEVRVRVGPVDRRLRVTGPRAWVRGAGGGWTLTEPEACLEVPLVWEHAFGGVARGGGREARFEANPLGVGFARPWSLEGATRVEAPRIEDADDPVTELGKDYAPAGTAVWGRAWPGRVERAGTYDDAWLAHTWPRLPRDFDFAYWNGAAPGMVASPWLRGDEEVALEGLHSAGEVRMRLPGHGVFVLVRYDDGAMVPLAMRLDALVLDVARGLAFATWRVGITAADPIRVAELRMDFRDPDEAHDG